MRNLLSKLLIAGAILFPLSLERTLSQTPTKENLDMPFDAIGENEEEEEAPEIVNFYGTNLEGDAFMYVVDRSGSMNDSGELSIAKREVTKNIREFSSRVEFGAVFFDRNLASYPAGDSVVKAAESNKSAGINFVNSVQAGSGSCPGSGLEKGLRMINNSSSARRVMVYLGDGGGTCGDIDEADYLRQTLTGVTSSNYKRVKINTVGVLNPSPIGEDFMKKLASNNQGTYTKISK